MSPAPTDPRLTVEVVRESEPICGELSFGGANRMFRGWLELFAAVEEMRVEGALSSESEDGLTGSEAGP